MQMENQVIQVNIDDIIPNRFQPRIAFDEKALNELSASIKEHGIIQPLVLRKLGKKYEIIAGERRYKAATLAGLQTVPAVISNIDDNKSAEIALVENIQRKNLTAIEEARSYKNLLDKGYLTQEQLAKKMGLSQSAISNKLRLLNLDNTVQQALLDGKISERHARSLLVLNDKEEQKKWLNRIINERLTVRQLDQILKEEVSGEGEESDVPLVNLTPNIEEMKEQATDINNNKPKDISNLLVSEDTMTEYSDNLPNQSAPAAPMDNTSIQGPTSIDNMPDMMANQPQNAFNDIVNSANPNKQEVLNAIPPTNGKFFNQLEEEPATMNNLNPFAQTANFTIDNSAPTQDVVEPMVNPFESQPTNIQSDVSQQPINDDVEIFDMPTNQNAPTPELTPLADNTFVQPTMPEEPIIPGIDELNPNNKFFQPAPETSIDSQTPIIDTPTPSVNPMDYVENLQQPVNENVNKPEISEAINSVKELVDNLGSKGFNVRVDEVDLDATYQMNISIQK